MWIPSGSCTSPLWHVRAFAGGSEREFREFFSQLGGQRQYAVQAVQVAEHPAAFAEPRLDGGQTLFEVPEVARRVRVTSSTRRTTRSRRTSTRHGLDARPRDN